MTPFQRSARAVLEQLRPGEVVTYGEIAAQAGFPGAARAVGNLLRDSSGLPWWRVVDSDGRLVPGSETEQELHLKSEGILVRNGRVARSRVRHSQMKERHP